MCTHCFFFGYDFHWLLAVALYSYFLHPLPLPSPSPSLEGRRNSAALVRAYVSQNAATKDRALMDFLGIAQARYETHYANHHRNIVEAVQAALMEWAGSSPPKTWKMLVEAMGLAGFAVQDVRVLTEELQKGTCAHVLCACIF